ncbi:hypothetical protein ABIC49_003336 [Burkholderia ambifaria]
MTATERITMTMRELDRFKVIQDVADGKLKPWRAAERLELTTRQVRRLVARLREHGPQGLVSGRYAKPSNNRLDAVIVDRALSIIRDRYADFGPTLACEKLWECSRHSAGQGNDQEADDGRWLVGSAPTTSAEGVSASGAPGMPG